MQNISCRDVVEIAVPPAFMICFLLVYSSSNSHVFSAVGNQEMGFEQIAPSAFYYLVIYWAFDNGMLFMLSQLCNYKIKISMRKDIIMPMFEKYGKGNCIAVIQSSKRAHLWIERKYIFEEIHKMNFEEFIVIFLAFQR